jgi:shikimate kinase
MGTGKSTVGAILADRLRLPFVDSDAELTRRFSAPARQIRDEGEPVLRARERALVQELVGGTPWVLATGGGLWVDLENRDALRRVARLVVLRAPLATLQARVAGGPDRPLWAQAEALLARRATAYADADLTVDTEARSPAEVAEAILAWWRG